MLQVKLCFTIKGHAFVPKPDVDVAVMRFTPKKKPLIDVSQIYILYIYIILTYVACLGLYISLITVEVL